MAESFERARNSWVKPQHEIGLIYDTRSSFSFVVLQSHSSGSAILQCQCDFPEETSVFCVALADLMYVAKDLIGL